MGFKAFDYPKPPTLIKHLIQQSTKRDDIILDFYAGSGTTGHSTLILNTEDGGNRRFILVSDTESTNHEPDKNVCRDVAAIRLKRVIEGYHKTEGLPGNFAYMKAIRTPMDMLHDKIQHEQIWYALQLIHFDSISVYKEDKSLQSVSSNTLRLIYLPELTTEVLTLLNKTLANSRMHACIYTWRPAVVEQKCLYEHLTIEQIPEFLIDRFGGNI